MKTKQELEAALAELTLAYVPTTTEDGEPHLDEDKNAQAVMLRECIVLVTSFPESFIRKQLAQALKAIDEAKTKTDAIRAKGGRAEFVNKSCQKVNDFYQTAVKRKQVKLLQYLLNE